MVGGPHQGPAALLVAAAVLAAAGQGSTGSLVRDRIERVVQKEMALARDNALKKAVDAEFEIADADDSGAVSRAEFETYLVSQDHFSVDARKGGKANNKGTTAAAAAHTATGEPRRQGQWLGRQAAPGEASRLAASRTASPLHVDVKPVEVVGDSVRLDTSTEAGGGAEAEKTGFVPAFLSAVMMILVTELGDKTFFIAMLLALKHPRLIVYTGAVGALVAMTVISAVIGGVLPALLSKQYTTYLAALLFLYFGVKMLLEARELHVSGPPEKNEELEEAEEEVNAYGKKDELPSPGGGGASPGGGRGSSKRAQELQLRILSQAFVMTFLAEWGDRSQIATIAMATTKNPYGITLGGCIGHAMCTGLAVLGGQLLSSYISEKDVLLIGGVVFLLFAGHSVLVGE